MLTLGEALTEHPRLPVRVRRLGVEPDMLHTGNTDEAMNKTCCMCGDPASSLGYCDKHRGVMICQFVLDALEELELATAKEVADQVWKMTTLRFGNATIVAALVKLHQDGFLERYRSLALRKASRWRMV